MKQLTLVLALALLLPSTAAAQESGLGLTLEMRTDGTYYGNFFQATAGAPTVDVFAGTGQVQLELSGRSGRVFVRASGTAYDRFDPGGAVLGGGRLNFGAHYLEAFGGIRLRNPRVEVGSEIGSADVAVATGSYSLRAIPALEISALVDYYASAYSQTTERNHEFLGGGAALELRSFRYTFIPEFGAQFGHLDVRDDVEDYDEQTFWAAVTSIPVPAIYLNVRYRYRLRQYTTDSPIASNLGREDARHQVTLTGDMEIAGPWSLVVYYSFQNANSSLPSRVFTTHLLITGLAYQLGGR